MAPAFMTPGLLFLNTSRPNVLKALTIATPELLKAGYNRFVEPACGAMQLCQTAQKAGFSPAVMEASDVSLYSTAMGRAIMGQRLDDLGVRAQGFEHEDLGDPATIMWADAVCRAEAKSKVVYWAEIARSMKLEREAHLARLNEMLGNARKRLQGLQYMPMDVFEHLDQVIDDPNAVIVLNPPSSKEGYEKLFDTGGRVTWNEPAYEVFDPVPAYERLNDYMARAEALLLIKEENQGGFEPQGQVLVHGSTRKNKGDRGITRSMNSYAVCNRPEEFTGYTGGFLISQWAGFDIEHPKWPIMGPDDEITEDSSIRLVPVSGGVAQYYRCLWTHQFQPDGSMGISFAVLVDEKVAGVCGYSTYVSLTAVSKGQHNIHYAIPPFHKTYRLVRLLLRLCLCRDTLRLLMSDANQVYISEVHTGVFTKHPEAKQHRGIMKLLERDKRRGVLIYGGAIVEKSWRDCLVTFVKDEARWRKARSRQT